MLLDVGNLGRRDLDDSFRREHLLCLLLRSVAEEHDLRTREQVEREDDDALGADRGRLSEVAVELDRCWDLLRQRRALRGAGADPDDASARDAGTVERYLQ